MTKLEAIRQLQRQVSPVGERASIEAISMAITALEKGNEPAPAEADTSSGTQNKFSQDNDNTDSEICQADVAIAQKTLVETLTLLSIAPKILNLCDEIEKMLKDGEQP